MTIIAPETTNPITTPDDEIISRARHNAALVATQGKDSPITRKGPVAQDYLDNPVDYRPDGTRAKPIPAELDATYGEAITEAEIFYEVDSQIIGTNGTGPATIDQVARFTRKRRAAGAPKMTLADVLSLAPFRVYRALADLIDETLIENPYTQLLDLVLTAKERTSEAERAAATADATFPEEQKSLAYRSRAEEILADLDATPVQDDQEDSDLAPELVYEIPGSIDPEADEEVEDALAELDVFDRVTLPADDHGSWLEAHLQGRPHRFIAVRQGDIPIQVDDIVEVAPELYDALMYS